MKASTEKTFAVIAGTLPSLTAPPPWLRGIELQQWHRLASHVARRRSLRIEDAPLLLAGAIASGGVIRRAGSRGRRRVAAAVASELAELVLAQLSRS
jgi:hypothetical protein